jgi:hypothetical protein
MSLDDADLERLLARGRLSGAAYDRIEARVFARTSTRRGLGRNGRWTLLAAALCGVVALGVAFVRPAREVTSLGFRAKGGPSPAAAGAVELSCSSEGRPCRVGDTLMFLVDSDAVSGYLSASAVRLDPPSEERTLYFPTRSGEAPYVGAGHGTVVASEGVRLTGAGLYRVEIRFSKSKPERVPWGEDTTGVLSVPLRIEE